MNERILGVLYSKGWTRLFQVSLALWYVVCAIAVIDDIGYATDYGNMAERVVFMFLIGPLLVWAVGRGIRWVARGFLE